MYEEDSEGFVAVLEEKDLEHLAEIIVQQKELDEGTLKERSVTDIPVLLIKKNGEVFALVNQCPHLGSPLAPGWNGDYILTCYRGGCEGLSYDIRTGKAGVYDYSTGKMTDHPDQAKLSLNKFDCKIKDGKIWLKLSR
jgi:nitrite reductase/ring-hydroxylating ferredoxin subunit